MAGFFMSQRQRMLQSVKDQFRVCACWTFAFAPPRGAGIFSQSRFTVMLPDGVAPVALCKGGAPAAGLLSLLRQRKEAKKGEAWRLAI
jgi:hypothetical protein